MKRHEIGPTTERLILRAMSIDDADAFYALNSHPEVMRHTGEPPLDSVDDARNAIENYADFRTIGYGRWGCYLKESEKLIGFCGLKYLDDLKEVDLGYRLLPEYWGRGLATEACLASVAFGFDVLKLDRIIGLVLPENAASIRVLEKVGMGPDGEVDYDGHLAMRYAMTNKSIR